MNNDDYNNKEYQAKIEEIYVLLRKEWNNMLKDRKILFNKDNPSNMLKPIKTEYLRFIYAYKSGMYISAYEHLCSFVKHDSASFNWPDNTYLCYCIIRAGEDLNI